MEIYHRYKKDPEGMLKLVELLEETSPSKRKKMIQAGNAEDPKYTEKAVSLMIGFDDVLMLNPIELAEVLFHSTARSIGLAISLENESIRALFLRAAPRKYYGDIKEILDQNKFETIEVEGAKIRIIQAARKVCQQGLILKNKLVHKNS